MWTRSLLKQNAKQALSGRYWKCFLVSFVIYLVSGGVGSIFTTIINFGNSASGGSGSPYYPGGYVSGTLPAAVMTVVGFLIVLGGIAGLCWNIFIVNPLEVGSGRYYMESRQAPAPYTTVTGIFRKPYGNLVEVLLLTKLKIFLGSLIVIPGIYWSFCYALVPYLLAENPYMKTSRAMELSKEMMYGEKWNFFVLQLSFIGWWLLCILTCGIGVLFLTPYVNATNAEFYAAMRSKALNIRMSDPQELGGFMRHTAI